MRRLILCDTGPLYALADPSDQCRSQAQSELAAIARHEIATAILYPNPRRKLHSHSSAAGRGHMDSLESTPRWFGWHKHAQSEVT